VACSCCRCPTDAATRARQGSSEGSGAANPATARPSGPPARFTAADLGVLTAALTQIPAPWRTDVLVSIDGAGASHDVIDYLTALNTALEHGHRGRRVENTIGWPVEERTMAEIEQPRESDWGAAVHAAGDLDPRRRSQA